jgi:hypothetical protein
LEGEEKITMLEKAYGIMYIVIDVSIFLGVSCGNFKVMGHGND